jgi:hypothetical protein
MVIVFWNALTIEHCTKSTYKHTHILKTNNSYVTIRESSHCILTAIVSIVTSAVVEVGSRETHYQLSC